MQCINVTNQQIVCLKFAQCYVSISQLKKKTQEKKAHKIRIHINTKQTSILIFGTNSNARIVTFPTAIFVLIM